MVAAIYIFVFFVKQMKNIIQKAKRLKINMANHLVFCYLDRFF